MIYDFFKEFKALLRFKALLKVGRVGEAAVAYKKYLELSNNVEKRIEAEINEAKTIFQQHLREVENLRAEML